MKVYKNFNLKDFNSYKLEAYCSRAIFPETEQEIVSVYENSNDKNIFILGNGNNVILSKLRYDEEFIIFNGNYNKVVVKENLIVAQAGATMSDVSELALQNGLEGVEIFYDIPSSVGGAVVMNAGADGEEIKDILVKVRCYNTLTNEFCELSKLEIGYEYRKSIFQQKPHLIVTKAWFELQCGEKDTIKAKMESIKESRWSKQPREFPNAGSVFKRPKGYYVGALIDDLGLKGYTIGGAKISEKHGGFIINFNKAFGQDILGIIEFVQQRVKENYGILLEVEQKVI